MSLTWLGARGPHLKLIDVHHVLMFVELLQGIRIADRNDRCARLPSLLLRPGKFVCMQGAYKAHSENEPSVADRGRSVVTRKDCGTVILISIDFQCMSLDFNPFLMDF